VTCSDGEFVMNGGNSVKKDECAGFVLLACLFITDPLLVRRCCVVIQLRLHVISLVN
jgi:hypothetical protein